MGRFNDVYTYILLSQIVRDGYLAVCQWNRGVNIFINRLLMFPVYLEAVNIDEKTITNTGPPCVT